MELRGPSVLEAWRVVVLPMGMLIAMGILAMRLYNVQVVRGFDYEDRRYKQSVRRVLLPSPRGRILDRNDKCLADNRPNYCLGVFIEELRRAGPWDRTIDAVENELTRISIQLDLPRTFTRQEIATHVARRLPLPFLAWRDLDEYKVAKFAEVLDPFPGIDIHVQPERIYPEGQLAAHILGHVGRERLDATNLEDNYHYIMMGMVGRDGIEKHYDNILEGEPGGELILVDAAGYKRKKMGGKEAQPGLDLKLTIDSGLQAAVEKALGDNCGAAVVMDPNNGDILAMASAPSYDPNTFSPAPTVAEWQRLMNDPNRPLFNRAVQGRYAPGSAFKPIAALGALTDKRFNAETYYNCHGSYDLKPHSIHCAFHVAHGPVNLRRALEVSCNTYFCELGATVGYVPIHDMAAKFGFGTRTEIDLPAETPGLLPDEAWKKRVYRDSWRLGDTCLISIGQGALLVSPLQMAVATAAIANGGRVLRPRLTHSDDTGETVRRIHFDAASLDKVRAGLADVVESGTGRRVGGLAVAVAGKTGTAEYIVARQIRKHAWMIAYAPADAPTVAMVAVIEDAESGGKTAAPVIRSVLAHMFGVVNGNAGAGEEDL